LTHGIAVKFAYPVCTPNGHKAKQIDNCFDNENRVHINTPATAGNTMAGIASGMGDGVKMVLVVNESLRMSKGKIAAQAGHATLACALTVMSRNPVVRRAILIVYHS
jgi:hypothetical protein